MTSSAISRNDPVNGTSIRNARDTAHNPAAQCDPRGPGEQLPIALTDDGRILVCGDLYVPDDQPLQRAVVDVQLQAVTVARDLVPLLQGNHRDKEYCESGSNDKRREGGLLAAAGAEVGHPAQSALRPPRTPNQEHRRFLLPGTRRPPRDGITPAEELLEKFHGPWGGSVDPVYKDYAY